MAEQSERPPVVLSPYTTKEAVSFIGGRTIDKVCSYDQSQGSCHPVEGMRFIAMPRPESNSFHLCMQFSEAHMESELKHATEPPAPEFVNLNKGILFFKADIEALLEYLLGTAVEFHPEFAEAEHQDRIRDGLDYRYPYYWGGVDVSRSSANLPIRRRQSRLQRYYDVNNDVLGDSLNEGRTSIYGEPRKKRGRVLNSSQRTP